MSIFWQYAKKLKSNLVLVVGLVLESKGLSLFLGPHNGHLPLSVPTVGG